MPQPPPAIGSHRLLGTGSSAALLRPDATVDWWCAPAFDDRPVLWSLLDSAGAAARWRGVRMVDATGPPAGATARTILHHVGGRVLCWDGLLRRNGVDVRLIRLVQALDADLVLEHELAVGGFDAATLPRAGRGTGRAEDALAVLRACTYEATGSVVVSPTTSLPEAPDGDRQFDYRYT